MTISRVNFRVQRRQSSSSMAELDDTGFIPASAARLSGSDKIPLRREGSQKEMDQQQTAVRTMSESPHRYWPVDIPTLSPKAFSTNRIFNDPSVTVLLAMLNQGPFYNLALASIFKFNPERIEIPTLCEYLRKVVAASLMLSNAKSSRKKFTSQFHEAAFQHATTIGHFNPNKFDKALDHLDEAVIILDQMMHLCTPDFNTPRPASSTACNSETSSN